MAAGVVVGWWWWWGLVGKLAGQRGSGKPPLSPVRVGVVVVVLLRVAPAVVAAAVVVVAAAVVMVVAVVPAVLGHRVSQGYGAAKAHDGLGHVVQERRELVAVDRPLPVHVVDVEDELHLLVPAASARHR